MTRKYQRRGQPSAPTPLENKVEPVSMDALNETAAVEMDSIGHTPEVMAKIEAAKPKMVPVLLERHYRPAGDEYEIVGHWKPKVEVKNAQGKMVEIEPATFIDGEPMPPPIAGVGSVSSKLWAGTVVRLPADEAKRCKREAIGSIEVD